MVVLEVRARIIISSPGASTLTTAAAIHSVRYEPI